MIINVVMKLKMGDMVLIFFCGSLEYVKFYGKVLIMWDGEVIEGDVLDDVIVMGVVMYFLNCVKDVDDRLVI